MFLDDEEIVRLTGFKRKSKQIAQLRLMGVGFLINATGHPVITKAILESRKPIKEESQQEWRPTWAGNLT